MEQGKVKFFDEKKGWGFIEPKAGGDDLFVHYSEIQGKGFKKLTEGDKVEYQVVNTSKGPKAVQVKLI